MRLASDFTPQKRLQFRRINRLGLHKRLLGHVRKDFIYEVAPKRRDDKTGNLLLHRGVVIITHPCANNQVWGIADYPGITVVVRGTGLYRYVAVGDVQGRIRAVSGCSRSEEHTSELH